MARLRAPYLLLTAGLLILEICIARFAHDRFVRPFVGDFLATILVYCFLKSWWRAPTAMVAGTALLISYLIEGAQALHLLRWLGWEQSPLARLLLGSQFEWGDMLAYTLGAAVVLGVERWWGRPAQGEMPSVIFTKIICQ